MRGRAAPAKLRPGYANFAIDDPPLKPVLNSPGNGPGGTINYLGAEVSSTGEVIYAETRQPSLTQERNVDLAVVPVEGLGVGWRCMANR